MTFGLTEKQAEILAFLRKWFAENDVAPTYREIAKAVGIKGYGEVVRVISGLCDRGYVRRLPNRARSLQLIDKGAPNHDRMRQALERIRRQGCEKSTLGLGSCYEYGLTEDSQYTAERVCNPCLADRALKEE